MNASAVAPSLSDPVAAKRARSPWRTMESAPRDRIILVKISFRHINTATAAVFEEAHGAFCALPLSNAGLNYAPLWPQGWMELPDVDLPNIRD